LILITGGLSQGINRSNHSLFIRGNHQVRAVTWHSEPGKKPDPLGHVKSLSGRGETAPGLAAAQLAHLIDAFAVPGKGD